MKNTTQTQTDTADPDPDPDTAGRAQTRVSTPTVQEGVPDNLRQKLYDLFAALLDSQGIGQDF